jgi:hypothetical protein
MLHVTGSTFRRFWVGHRVFDSPKQCGELGRVMPQFIGSGLLLCTSLLLAHLGRLAAENERQLSIVLKNACSIVI